MDSDSDGVGNMCDEDDDNDGILDAIESPNTNTILWVNSNGVATTEEQNTIHKQTALGYTVTVVDDNVGAMWITTLSPLYMKMLIVVLPLLTYQIL